MRELRVESGGGMLLLQAVTGDMRSSGASSEVGVEHECAAVVNSGRGADASCRFVDPSQARRTRHGSVPRHDTGLLVVTDTLCSRRGRPRYSQIRALAAILKDEYATKNSLSKKLVFPSIEISSIQSKGFSVL
jgi:hypothetical protein